MHRPVEVAARDTSEEAVMEGMGKVVLYKGLKRVGEFEWDGGPTLYLPREHPIGYDDFDHPGATRPLFYTEVYQRTSTITSKGYPIFEYVRSIQEPPT